MKLTKDNKRELNQIKKKEDTFVYRFIPPVISITMYEETEVHL